MNAGIGVGVHLSWRLGPGDNCGNSRMGAAKAERQTRKCLPFGENGLNLGQGGETRFDVDTRKSLADVEGLPVAVVAPVVIGRKDRIGSYLPGEQPRRQRHARR